MSDALNETPSNNEKTARKPQILAVDDTPVMLKTISFALGNDYEVFTLSDPMLVEKFLQQIKPDLILLDYKMPGLSGFDLVHIIRKFEEHKDTPIIFLTSMGTNDNILTAAKLGASDFIVKPVKASLLREKVAKHIAEKNHA
jgi:DNA-binding response OmpR family regulator